MVAAIDPAAVALIAALAAPVVSYVIAARRFSGKIETSDAKELWAESRAIRDWSQARIASLTDDVERLERRVQVLETSNSAQLETIAEQREELAKLRIEITQAKAGETVAQEKVLDLSTRLESARQRVSELEAQVARQ